MFGEKELSDVTLVVDGFGFGQRKKSILWNHFTKVQSELGIRKCKCNICGKLVSNTSGSTSRMISHMKVHHEHELNTKMQKKLNSSQSISQSDSQNIIFKTPSVFNQPEEEPKPHVNVGSDFLHKTAKPSAGVLKAVLDYLYLGTTAIPEDCAVEMIIFLDNMKIEVEKSMNIESKTPASDEMSTIKVSNSVLKLPHGIEIITNWHDSNIITKSEILGDYKQELYIAQNSDKLYENIEPNTTESMIPIEESGETIKVKIENKLNIKGVQSEKEKPLFQSSPGRENSIFFCTECDFHSLKRISISIHKKSFTIKHTIYVQNVQIWFLLS